MADILGTLFLLALVLFAGIGVVCVVLAVMDLPSGCDCQRLAERRRRAECEISQIGQWEQQAITAALLRQALERRPGNQSSRSPAVIDGEWELP